MTLTWKTMRAALCAAALVAVSADLAAAAAARAASNTNLRQGPGTDFGVIVTVPGGGLVNVIRCNGEWCNVTFRGQPGYMIARNLAFACSGPAGAPSGRGGGTGRGGCARAGSRGRPALLCRPALLLAAVVAAPRCEILLNAILIPRRYQGSVCSLNAWCAGWRRTPSPSRNCGNISGNCRPDRVLC